MTSFWLPPTIFAGMPAPELVVTELGKRRLEEISFFLVSFFLGAAVFRLLWNRVQHDVPWWPRLTYRGTLAMLCVWGLLLTVVLSLISGARELMTPAAWRPNGVTYQPHPSGDHSHPDLTQREARIQRIVALQTQLWKYAAEHDGQFPRTDEQQKAIPQSFWIAVPEKRLKYEYSPEVTSQRDLAPLLTEPDYFDDGQLMLRKNGELVSIKHVRSPSRKDRHETSE